MSSPPMQPIFDDLPPAFDVFDWGLVGFIVLFIAHIVSLLRRDVPIEKP